MRLPLGDLADVINREGDPAAVLMEGNLPAVRASSQCALRQVFQPQLTENFRCLRWRVDASKPKRSVRQEQPCSYHNSDADHRYNRNPV